MSQTEWEGQFRAVYDRSVEAWNQGKRRPPEVVPPSDHAFLASIGCSAQELFDFVEDGQSFGEPDFETVLAVQSIRREYFLKEMHGRSSGQVGSSAALPAKDAAMEGIPWLPRIIAKARLKLRGEMPPEIMYGCGGDRAFLKRVHMTIPQFLKSVRDAGSDDRKIMEAVKRWSRV
ncbi:MAG: DUF5069 domain-containing protein [Verrucomicrobiales bacterium]|nr:DUF5069 domain-containing protein [Verrucomicrobiales bacterium]